MNVSHDKYRKSRMQNSSSLEVMLGRSLYSTNIRKCGCLLIDFYMFLSSASLSGTDIFHHFCHSSYVVFSRYPFDNPALRVSVVALCLVSVNEKERG